MKKIVIALALAIFVFTATAYADVLISEVLYDPAGTDTGLEWVELYNPTSSDINLENYSIETGNGAEENDWKSGWTGTRQDKIRAYGFFLIGESDVPVRPDVTTTLDLQNGPDAVRIIGPDSQVLDTLGWGTHTFSEYYEGTPAEDVDGVSLERKPGYENPLMGNYLDTDNNSADFIINSYPYPQNSSFRAEDYENPTSNNLGLNLEVVSHSLKIKEIMVKDEDGNDEGIQIYPDAGNMKAVSISAVIECETGYEEISRVWVEFLGRKEYLINQSHHENNATYYGELQINFTDEPGQYVVNIIANSTGSCEKNSTGINIELVEMSALEIDTDSIDFGSLHAGQTCEMIGDKNMQTKDRVTIRNIGNTEIDIALSSQGLSSDDMTLPSENINYSFMYDDFDCDLAGSLSPYSKTVPVGIMPASLLPLSFRVSVPEIESGTYSGKAVLTAVPR